MKKQKRYKKPNIFVYKVFYLVSKLACKIKFNLKVEHNDLKGIKGPFVVIGNHESAIDFMPACVAIKQRIHFVISNSFYSTLKIRKLLDAVGCIPKNQFQTSVVDMKKMKIAVDNGSPIFIYPAGLMSENGISTPVPTSTAKTLKWFGKDVYVLKTSGSYLTDPKWSKKWRKGKITVNVEKFIDAESLKNINHDELNEKVQQALYYDAYSYQEKVMQKFKGGNNIDGLEKVLYKCPHCNGEYTVRSNGFDTLTCDCGYSVKGDEYGFLNQNCDVPLIYKKPSDWAKFIENSVKEEILADENYILSAKTQIHMINDTKHKFEQVGEGVVTLDRKQFTLAGTINGQKIEKTFPTIFFPMLPFKPGVRFELQDSRDIYRCVLEDGKQVTKWIYALKTFFNMNFNN